MTYARNPLTFGRQRCTVHKVTAEATAQQVAQTLERLGWSTHQVQLGDGLRAVYLCEAAA